MNLDPLDYMEMPTDCPQVGVMGYHSEGFYEGAMCIWCGYDMDDNIDAILRRLAKETTRALLLDLFANMPLQSQQWPNPED